MNGKASIPDMHSPNIVPGRERIYPAAKLLLILVLRSTAGFSISSPPKTLREHGQ